MRETLWHDVRHGARVLRRSPAFTLAAVGTLALAIGSTAGIFTVVNAALLRPPPYPEPGRIHVLANPDGGAQNGAVVHFARDRIRTFARIAALRGSTGWNLATRDHVEHVVGLPVSEGYFDVLGVAPLVGRGFTEAEDRPDGPRAVVIAERLWRRVFAGDPAALGATVDLGGVAHTVVGVMPAAFRSIPAADVWTPLQVSPADTSWNYQVLGRLRQGGSEAQAAAELDTIRTDLLGVPGVSEGRSEAIRWVPYQRWLGQERREPLLLLLGSVAFLLLIACVNVAGLQLARAVARRREMATRAALGGGQGRLLGQVLTESLLLAVVGAAGGVALAWTGIRLLWGLVPPALLNGAELVLDWRVLAVTVAVTLGAGIGFGLAPALRVRRLDVREALGAGARQIGSASTLWVHRAFVVAQIALAVVLLVGAGLLVRTMVSLQQSELGFDPRNVIVGRMSLQGSAEQSTEAIVAFFDGTLDRLRATPGVEAAAVSNNVPVERGLNLAIEPPADGLVDQVRAVDWRYTTPGYFDALRIPLRAGRAFDRRDQAAGAPAAIVDEAFVRTFFGEGARVVGRTIQLDRAMDDPPREIVGVVAGVRSRSGAGWTTGRTALGADAPPTVYVPAAQAPREALGIAHTFFPVTWTVRTTGTSAGVERTLRDIVRSTDARLPFIGFEPMSRVVARDLELERFLMSLLAVFAAVALALAAIGLYGLVAYAVAQRAPEVGIRMALGATGTRVLRGFVLEGGVLVAAGLATGLAGAALVGRLLVFVLFGVEPLDPTTIVAVCLVLAIVTGVATVVPAWQAARLHPLRALRRE